ncbi:hypothetical protein [Paenibacillus graminis]|uniref:hypothetical protein n=1 Tax=Paenibacillus graminis TaxID=189425 RepID=UPI002DB57A77|nr:hypothetical protein [Paenibacillus graminis]MEC0167385.1 hypothetical protein [Paenibacillus graminis]
MKKVLASLMVVLSLFVLPVMAFAEDKSANPMTQLKKYLSFDSKVLENIGFILTPVGLVISVMVVAILVFCVFQVIKKLITSRTTKGGTIKDKAFWIEIGVTLLITFLFLSGAFFDFLEAVYNWTYKQDVVGTTTSMLLNWPKNVG